MKLRTIHVILFTSQVLLLTAAAALEKEEEKANPGDISRQQARFQASGTPFVLTQVEPSAN